MSLYARLVIKVVFVTVAFALLLFAAVMTPTLTFQSHIHPDDWTTTTYDIAAAALVVLAYVAVMVRIAYNFLRARSNARA